MEDAVRRILIHALPALVEYVPTEEISSFEICHRLNLQASYLSRINTATEYANWLKTASLRIVVGFDMLTIHIPQENLSKLMALPPDEATEQTTVPPAIPATIAKEGDRLVLSAYISFKPRRGHSEIVDQRTGKAITARSTIPDPALIQVLAQAEFWRSELARHPEKPLEKITADYGIKPRYIRRLLNAAYLAPTIKRAIFQGTQPAHLQVQDLIASRALDWHTQMQELGFENPTRNA